MNDGGRVKIEQKESDKDIILFHELNHYRHLLLKKKSYQCVDGFYRPVDLNPPREEKEEIKEEIIASSDNIKLRSTENLFKISKKHCMKNCEEELQLTGYTLVKKEILKDSVNEISYRIAKNSKFVRFPYELYDDLEIKGRQGKLSISYEDAKSLISASIE